ncbi:MAG TPA: hypothetical protein VMU30_06705 [Bacteroidota bacterium]|nr:hypothetical protein [Bacteroidota bacterium]
MTDDLHIFSHEHIHEQLKTAEFRNGYFILQFYSENNLPSSKPASSISKFYLYPSGGTLRDEQFNLITYDSRYDTYRGFQPPCQERPR